ncbi:MAG: Mut7-C RNAse domain-containing protein [Nitrososphaerota archaeon]|nr:Mut7-C RNAse domain-containing protein [Nitrososphaerota archaeon]MDG7025684.1 Mut7-C RNAse domain-containing protein [Nitrososphaerota archaeon]
MATARARPAFAADAMLGSLARKLRALGFDTTYYRSGGDAQLVKLAAMEGRVVLTSDRALAGSAMAKGVAAVLLRGGSDSRRLSEIAAAAGPLGFELARGDPFCSLCGGALEMVGKGGVSGKVPAGVQRSHREFFVCVACGQAYWKGSHWKKLRSLAGRLGQKQLATNNGRREGGGRAGEGDAGSPSQGVPPTSTAP